jgi:hypothetical protein
MTYIQFPISTSLGGRVYYHQADDVTLVSDRVTHNILRPLGIWMLSTTGIESYRQYTVDMYCNHNMYMKLQMIWYRYINVHFRRELIRLNWLWIGMITTVLGLTVWKTQIKRKCQSNRVVILPINALFKELMFLLYEIITAYYDPIHISTLPVLFRYHRTCAQKLFNIYNTIPTNIELNRFTNKTYMHFTGLILLVDN